MLPGRDRYAQSGPLVTDEEMINQDCINASCQAVIEIPGRIYFDILESFTMIRGGRMNLVVMGALQSTIKAIMPVGPIPPAAWDVGNNRRLHGSGRRPPIDYSWRWNMLQLDGSPKIVKKADLPANNYRQSQYDFHRFSCDGSDSEGPSSSKKWRLV